MRCLILLILLCFSFSLDGRSTDNFSAETTAEKFPYSVETKVVSDCTVSLLIQNRVNTKYKFIVNLTEEGIQNVLKASGPLAIPAKSMVIIEVFHTWRASGYGMIEAGLAAKILNLFLRNVSVLQKKTFLFISIIVGGLYPVGKDIIVHHEETKKEKLLKDGMRSFYVYEEDIPNFFKNIEALLQSAKMQDGSCLEEKLPPRYSNGVFINHLRILLEIMAR